MTHPDDNGKPLDPSHGFNADTFMPVEWIGARRASTAGVVLAETARLRSNILPSALPEGGAIASTSRWSRAAVPTYSQRTDDCVGHATANFCEGIARGYIVAERLTEILAMFLKPELIPFFQVDGNSVWKLRKDDLKEPYKGGLTVDGGFLALLKREILRRCKLILTPPDFASIMAALETRPLVQGHGTHRGWGRPKPPNAYIEGLGDLPNPFAGHATLCLSVYMQRLNDLLQRYSDLLNSWGRRRWGWHGTGLLHEADHNRSVIGNLVSVVPDDGTSWSELAEDMLIRLGQAGLIIAVRDEDAD